MRGLLAAMREDGDRPELAPQPGLSDPYGLLSAIRRAGLAVELQVEGTPAALPAAIDLSAYRIIQEGLTNTLKHAAAAHADVVIRYGADELEIAVHDDGRAGPAGDGKGPGLVGMRERVKIYGGEMTARPAAGGASSCARAFRSGATRDEHPRPRRDDQSMVRAGFRMLLGGEPDIEVVAEASTGREAIAKVARFDPTVVLVDSACPSSTASRRPAASSRPTTRRGS